MALTIIINDSQPLTINQPLINNCQAQTNHPGLWPKRPWGYDLWDADGFEFVTPGADGEPSIQAVLAESKRRKQEEAKGLCLATDSDGGLVPCDHDKLVGFKQ